VTDEQLAAAFASCGKITSAVVNRDASGMSKRHGFCNFESPESAVKCIEQFNDTENLAMAGDRIAVMQHLKGSVPLSKCTLQDALLCNFLYRIALLL
jgi:RNA recognition motif-containing protein